MFKASTEMTIHVPPSFENAQTRIATYDTSLEPNLWHKAIFFHTLNLTKLVMHSKGAQYEYRHSDVVRRRHHYYFSTRVLDSNLS
ncbi:MAG: hypothetical protein ACI9BS_000897 [Candidatus Poriferisodalaceae bacterium]